MSANVETAQRYMSYHLANNRTSCLALVRDDVVLQTAELGCISGKDALMDFLKSHPLKGAWENPRLDLSGNVTMCGRTKINGEKAGQTLLFEFDDHGKIRKMKYAPQLRVPGGPSARSSMPAMSGARSSMTKAFGAITGRRSNEPVQMNPRQSAGYATGRSSLGRTNSAAGRASQSAEDSISKAINALNLQTTAGPRASGGRGQFKSPRGSKGALGSVPTVEVVGFGDGAVATQDPFVDEATAETVVTAQRFMKYRLANDKTGCLALVTTDIMLRTEFETQVSGRDELKTFLETTAPLGLWENARYDHEKGKVILPGKLMKANSNSRVDAHAVFDFDVHGKIQCVTVVQHSKR